MEDSEMEDFLLSDWMVTSRNGMELRGQRRQKEYRFASSAWSITQNEEKKNKEGEMT